MYKPNRTAHGQIRNRTSRKSSRETRRFGDCRSRPQEDLQPLELPAPFQAATSSGTSPSDPTAKVKARFFSRCPAELQARIRLYASALLDRCSSTSATGTSSVCWPNAGRLDSARQGSDGSLQPANNPQPPEIAHQRAGGQPLPLYATQARWKRLLGRISRQVRLHNRPGSAGSQ